VAPRLDRPQLFESVNRPGKNEKPARLIEARVYVQAISEFAQPILKGQGLPIQVPVLKADKSKPTYVSVAVSLQPERGNLDIWVPGTAVAEFAKMLEPVMKAVGQ
jgi:hypothetical protein